jgi:hypothetical protein
VESLNVGVACGVVLGEAWRQRGGQPSRLWKNSPSQPERGR